MGLIVVLLGTAGRVCAETVSAAAAVVLCGDTGEVLYEKNADSRLPMASTTKMMTALLLCEAGNLDREFVVTEEMVRVEGSSMGLLPGDTATRRDLLYGMLLASGNDAANATAFLLDGSLEAFVTRMNVRAAELGLCNTHFCTPSGLDADAHYTTATDLAHLAIFALQNADFSAAAAAKTATLYYGNPPYARTLRNHNRLLFEMDGIVGVKTGFTKKSGRCLVSALKKDGKYVVAVTLNDADDWADHKRLLVAGAERLTVVTLGGTAYEIAAAECGQAPCTAAAETVTVSVANPEKLVLKTYLPSCISAPCRAGETVGRAEYYCENRKIAVCAIQATGDFNAVSVPKGRRIWAIFKQLILSLG